MTTPRDATAAAIRVRARLFALQRELAGTRELELQVPDGAAIEDVWLALVARHPVLAPGRTSVRFARNGEYADATDPVRDGDEIAFIPPVSGGAGTDRGADGGTGEPGRAEPGTPDAANRILEVRADAFDDSILTELTQRLATPADGGVVGFLGRTRESAGTPAPGQEAEAARHVGRRVESLSYEAHEPMALRVLEAIADEIESRFGVRRVAIVHRLGDVPLGAPSIAVVAAAAHRDEAFRAARYAIDETKARAPIWKAEQFADGHVWIGEPARSGPPGCGPTPPGKERA